jgi:hypothetical protein
METPKKEVDAQIADMMRVVQNTKGRGIRVAIDGRDAADTTTFTDHSVGVTLLQ